jgi:alpha-tubulin suppressor-like RCC1 family protein
MKKRIIITTLSRQSWILCLIAWALGAVGAFGQSASVVVWGDNTFGETNVPANLVNVTSIAAGGSFCLTLNNNGTLFGWGQDTYGQTDVAPLPSTITAIAAGADFSVGLLADGTMYTPGNDSSGQINVPFGLTNVIAIAAGGFCSLALQANETVVAWGDDTYGETNVPPAATNVVAIAAGNVHQLALRSDGTVVAWGDGTYGQTDVPAGATNVVAIAAEGNDSFALRAGGAVVAWGNDYPGQSGVIPGVSNIVAISGDLAVRADGIVVPLGAATEDEREIPPGLTNVLAIKGAVDGSIGMALVGKVPPLFPLLINEFAFSGTSVLFPASAAGAFPLSYQWQFNGTNLPGANRSSLVLTNVQVGSSGSYTVAVTNVFGTNASPPVELTVINSGPIITSRPGNLLLPQGNIASFTVAATGSQPLYYHWRFNGTNIPGATNASLSLPGVNQANAGPYDVIVSNAFGSPLLPPYATLAIVPSTVVGWGFGGSAANIPANLTNAVEIADGGAYGLALIANGSVVGWGDDTYGETSIRADLINVLEISARNDYANSYALALTADGTVHAWGDNTYGECDVPNNLSNAIDILPASSSYLPMALTADGRVVEWSLYATNYLSGDTAVPAGLSNVVAIAEGGCNLALQSNGKVTAWGDPFNGLTNVPQNLSNVVAIAAGGTSLLALSANGQVTAWGGITNVPAGLTNVVAIAAGQNDFDVAITANGHAVAWGDNFLGALTPQQLYAATNVPPNITNAAAVLAGNYGCLILNQNTTVAGWGDDGGEVEMNLPPGLTNVEAIAAALSPYSQSSTYSSGMALEGHLPPVALPMANVFAYSGSSPVILEANVRGSALSYQWQLNGVNLPGANQPWLMLTNAQPVGPPPSPLANYTVIVSNAYGSVTNPASLNVVNSAPIILQPPQSLELPPDNNFTFSVQATGSQPMSYQWQFNGTNIPGATAPAYTVTNAQLPAAGYYSVVMSNPYGTNLSSSAGLSFSITSVTVWGNDDDFNGGPIDMPINLTDVIAVSAGAYHNLALLADGSVAGWGNNSYGQASVPAGLINVKAIAGGEWHSLALKADGTVMGWGDDVFGETDIPLGLSNVMSIAAGSYTSMALQSNGLVTVWGDTSGGQTTLPPVPLGLSNVVSIAESGFDFLALRSNGTVVEWGDNSYGQTNFAASLTNIIAIGSGDFASIADFAVKADGTIVAWGSVPSYMEPPPGLSNVVAVASGPYFGLAMLADRTVVVWGQEPGFDNDLNLPPGLTNVTGIGCGHGHGIVLDPAGGVITLVPTQAQPGGSQSGFLQATLTPPAAVAAGAGWGIIGQPYFSSNTNFTVLVSAGQSVALAFQSVTGWDVPESHAVTVPLGGLTNINISYSVEPPVMSAIPGSGFGLTGTTNTAYRIQYSTNLANGQWLTLATNTLGQGFNKFAPWPPTNHAPAIYYRAVWLP